MCAVAVGGVLKGVSLACTAQNVSADIADNCGSAVAVVACAVGHNTVVCGAVVVLSLIHISKNAIRCNRKPDSRGGGAKRYKGVKNMPSGKGNVIYSLKLINRFARRYLIISLFISIFDMVLPIVNVYGLKVVIDSVESGKPFAETLRFLMILFAILLSSSVVSSLYKKRYRPVEVLSLLHI